VRIPAPPRGALQCAPFLGWLAGSGFPTAISPEKSARFVRSLHSAVEDPRSARGALPGSGCRPPRWRFSVRHSRNGRGGVPRRSVRHCGQGWRSVLGVRPLSFTPRFPICFQAGERPPAHCRMAVIFGIGKVPVKPSPRGVPRSAGTVKRPVFSLFPCSASPLFVKNDRTFKAIPNRFLLKRDSEEKRWFATFRSRRAGFGMVV
jgi:hypothetical protein